MREIRSSGSMRGGELLVRFRGGQLPAYSTGQKVWAIRLTTSPRPAIRGSREIGLASQIPPPSNFKRSGFSVRFGVPRLPIGNHGP
jgi:hypothetical protein